MVGRNKHGHNATWDLASQSNPGIIAPHETASILLNDPVSVMVLFNTRRDWKSLTCRMLPAKLMQLLDCTQ